MNNFKYLVYDMETIINKTLLNKVLYGGQGLTDEEAYQAQLAELAEEGKEFVNPAFHKPFSIAVVAVAEDFTISKIKVLGDLEKSVASMVAEFWDIYAKRFPVLVDFNGKGFDARVLELWAFQLGLTIAPKNYFDKFGARNRFSELHLDLHEFLTNSGAIRYRGGLNLFSKMLGKPGKMETKGDMVQQLYESGDFFKIDDYCLGDTMDTYFVFLRTRVLMGQLSLTQEQVLVDLARQRMEELSKEQGYFKMYLANFGQWEKMT